MMSDLTEIRKRIDILEQDLSAALHRGDSIAAGRTDERLEKARRQLNEAQADRAAAVDKRLLDLKSQIGLYRARQASCIDADPVAAQRYGQAAAALEQQLNELTGGGQSAR